MKNSFFSIIIPAHNEENYLGATLKSLKNLSFKDYEVIVVCDTCSDSTSKIAKTYTNKVLNVQLMNVSAARNKGARKAKGDILVFCDADTIVSRNYLSSISRALKKGADYGCAKSLSDCKTLLGRLIIWLINLFNKKYRTMGGNCFVKKDLFWKVGGFNTWLKKREETDLGIKLSKKHDYAFITDSYVKPSERRFVTQGYIRHFLILVKETWKYLKEKT